MKLQINERHRSIAVLVIWVFSCCVLIGIGVWRFSAVMNAVEQILDTLSPILWGLAIAYLLSPLQNWTERRLKPLIERKKPHPKILRFVSVFLTIAVLLAALSGMLSLLLPELISSIKNLVLYLPGYMTTIGQWMGERIEGLEESQPQIHQMLISVWESLQATLNNMISEFEPKIDNLMSGASLLTSITSGAFTFVNALKDFVLGIILAIYLLAGKERHAAQVKKFLYAMMKTERVHGLLSVARHFSDTFMHYVSGKALDSFLVGLICFIGMTILNCPYAALISLTIGVTNIIPFFGPFIGAIPSGILILLSEPSKVIPFAIFILIMQQIDGNFLEPKILGDTLGLPTFWVLFAIFIGGGLFGFIGMVIFVPIFSAFYVLLSDYLNGRLKRKGMPSTTEDYMGADLIDARPQTVEASEESEPESNAADAGESAEDTIKTITENDDEEGSSLT